MKKVLLGLSILSYCLSGHSQKITKEQAQSICAEQMAAFTKAVSPVYKKGISYEQFQSALCGQLVPSKEGGNQLRVAYNFLNQGTSNDYIVRTYTGTEIAASLRVLSDLHSRGLESDGSELFGGKIGTENNGLAKVGDGGCHWYQFWCLIQQAASNAYNNWPLIAQIINVFFP